MSYHARGDGTGYKNIPHWAAASPLLFLCLDGEVGYVEEGWLQLRPGVPVVRIYFVNLLKINLLMSE